MCIAGNIKEKIFEVISFSQFNHNDLDLLFMYNNKNYKQLIFLQQYLIPLIMHYMAKLKEIIF